MSRSPCCPSRRCRRERYLDKAPHAPLQYAHLLPQFHVRPLRRRVGALATQRAEQAAEAEVGTRAPAPERQTPLEPGLATSLRHAEIAPAAAVTVRAA